MTSAEKLTWSNNNTSWQSVLKNNGERESLPLLKIVAPADGLYYIHLMASIEKDGKVLSKPFTIPVKVGTGEVKFDPVGEVSVDQNGQKVIIQDAETKD